MASQSDAALVEATRKSAQHLELANLIELSKMDSMLGYSDDIQARIVRIANLRPNKTD